jgi:hypothetical protein
MLPPLQYFLKTSFAVLLTVLCMGVNAQGYRDGKLYLNQDGSNYFKFTILSQAWLRYSQLNPGSTIDGYQSDAYGDVGIRRGRFQAYGQIADRVFLYSQFGINNFNFLSDRKSGFFIHDMTGAYEVARTKLWLGIGLSGWNGLSRFSAAATGSIMGLDAPLFEQTTNDVTDQFLRKLGIYAYGKLGRLDYRMVMSSPMAVTKSANYEPTISRHARFSPKPAHMQWHGYFKYDFFDLESNNTPYAAGTYLGAKRVLNIGMGFQFQPKAMWHQASNGDTLFSAMKHFAIDIYYDAPINKASGSAISAYAAYLNLNYGPGYLRNQATMNPANGSHNTALINGSGNGYPSFGTGSLWYAQIGYKFADSLVANTTFMPYASVQYARYDRLQGGMLYWDAGINWLLKGHNSKLTFAYQMRPLFYRVDGIDKARQQGSKGAWVMQYQVFLN